MARPFYKMPNAAQPPAKIAKIKPVVIKPNKFKILFSKLYFIIRKPEFLVASSMVLGWGFFTAGIAVLLGSFINKNLISVTILISTGILLLGLVGFDFIFIAFRIGLYALSRRERE